MTATPPEDEFGLLYKPDEIGRWSERKIDIVARYAAAYVNALKNQPFTLQYVDAFAGGGQHVRKGARKFKRGEPEHPGLPLLGGIDQRSSKPGDLVDGTVRRVLAITPPFTAFHFVEQDPKKAASLRQLSIDAPTRKIHVYEGDSNEILPTVILPQIRWDQYARALVFLDPYGLHLSWRTLEAAGKNRCIDALIHFPTADVVRNLLRKDRAGVTDEAAQRMSALWGSESWRRVAYVERRDLFGNVDETATIGPVLAAFRERLREAEFTVSTKAYPLRNSTNGIVYHLLLAAHSDLAERIATSILKAEIQEIPHG